MPQQHLVERDRVFDPGCRRQARHDARPRFAFGVYDHLGAIHQEQSFGAPSHSRPSRQLGPFDLAPFLSTLQHRRCRRRCKTRYEAVGYSLPRRVLPPACRCDLAWSLRTCFVGGRVSAEHLEQHSRAFNVDERSDALASRAVATFDGEVGGDKPVVGGVPLNLPPEGVDKPAWTEFCRSFKQTPPCLAGRHTKLRCDPR